MYIENITVEDLNILVDMYNSTHKYKVDTKSIYKMIVESKSDICLCPRHDLKHSLKDLDIKYDTLDNDGLNVKVKDLEDIKEKNEDSFEKIVGKWRLKIGK